MTLPPPDATSVPRPDPGFSAAIVAATVTRLRAAGCVFAEDEAALLAEAAHDTVHLDTLTARRAAGLPLEHVVGWAEFCGLRIAVDEDVFVPRRRTQFLARHAAALAAPGAVVVDLCCGAGAIGAAVASAVPGVELYAADIHPAAVRCARGNLAAYGARVFEGDLFAPLPADVRGRVAVLTANTPYVPTAEIGLLPSEARDHEPLVALDGGSDGLDLQRRIAAEAAAWLAPGGHLLVETSEEQAAEAVAVFTTSGLTARVVEDEDLYATVVVGTRPTAGA
ncbi:putative protein N(5)-glutamine methyltransferase [Uniformispora flossi]|uniref:putative protein N(5)-glutamine methyltransferase n=1 Tax=Uniformispora flossi TaxID=3390723 RepID=UPI003C2CB386